MAFSQSVKGLCAATTAAVAILAYASLANAEEITVNQWGGNSMYGAPFAVALDKDLFKQEGINITGIIGSTGGGTSVRNTFASETPYGEATLAAALAAAREGLDLIIVNTGARNVGDGYVVVMPGSDVKTINDLVGKKVAITSPKSSSEMLLLMALKEKSVDASKVSLVAAGGYVPALTMLEHNAVAGSVNADPLAITRKGRYRVLYKVSDLLPPMTMSVGITSRTFAKAHPEKLRAIIAARRKAVDAMYADPAIAVTAIEKLWKLSPNVAKEAVDNMVQTKMWSRGELSQAELDRTADGLRLIGELKEPVDWKKLIDRSFLPPDLKAEN
jgi:NitT/TauT family transport system substrate-binding protein